MSILSVPISLFPTKQRQFGEIKVDVIISESTNDTLTITKQPVQIGASITDHSYKEPTVFSATINFRDNSSNKPLDKIYLDLQNLQNSRAPFTIVTPKRVYQSMLISSLGMTTDKQTENCLAIQLSCQEVILVPVTATTIPRARQKAPQKTENVKPAGKKSGFLTAKEGLVGLVQRIKGGP